VRHVQFHHEEPGEGEGVGMRKMMGRSLEQHGQRWLWVDDDGCLDSVVTKPYGGRSRRTREEKTMRRGNRGPAWSPAEAR
jgi:hypothetical protein